MSKAHSARGHAKLSPSSAHRWFKCPGSIKLSDGIPNKSGRFADEGTAAHELAAKCLQHNYDPADFLGGYVDIKAGKIHRDDFVDQPGCFAIDEEMVEGVGLYVETIRSLILPGDDYEIECKLDLTHIPGMEMGTGDFLLYRPNTKSLWIADFKYGKGVPVEVEANEQLLTYAEGTAKRYHNRGLDKVTMMVVQPRCPHPKGPVRLWTVDVIDLAEFRFAIEDAAKATGEDDAPLVPGDHCRFCPAAATCPALQSKALQVAEMEFSDAPPPVSDLEGEQIAGILAKASLVNSWIRAVEARAHQMALDGTPPPGWKLVRSTSHRKFKDDVDAEVMAKKFAVFLDDLMTEPKLKSPAQVVKLIGKKREAELAEFVYKPPGKIILAPSDDPRDAVKPDAEDEFA